MAGFHTKTFTKHDDYMTPKTAWEAVSHLLPKDKIIWESAYGDGKSGEYLKELGFNIIHEEMDYFKQDPENWDIQVTNPPYTIKKEWLKRAVELKKPFMLLMPISTINTNYLRETLKGLKLQLIIPRKRIQFIKIRDGEIVDIKPRCNFDTAYFCVGLNLENDILFLDA